jgi:hypothetical protein
MKSTTILILKIMAIIIGALFIFSVIFLGGVMLIAVVCALIAVVIGFIVLFEKPKEFEVFDKDFVKIDSHKGKFLNEELNKLSEEDQANVDKLLNKNITQSILNAMDRHTVDYCRRLDK